MSDKACPEPINAAKNPIFGSYFKIKKDHYLIDINCKKPYMIVTCSGL